MPYSIPASLPYLCSCKFEEETEKASYSYITSPGVGRKIFGDRRTIEFATPYIDKIEGLENVSKGMLFPTSAPGWLQFCPHTKKRY